MTLLDNTLNRFNLRRFFSGEGPQAQPVALHHRKVYILPTRAGLMFAVLLLLMLTGSVNYSNNLAFIMTFVLASMAIISIIFTYRNLLNIKVTLMPAKAVFAGETLTIPVVLDNPHYPRFSVSISHSAGERFLVDIPASTSFRTDYSYPVKQRGLFSYPRFIFETFFPLGLFRAWSYVEVTQSFYVYPCPSGSRRLPQAGLYQSSLSGNKGLGSDDFSGQRKYRPGDSLKQVNWKAFAKKQGLLTKEYTGDRHEELWLRWEHTHERDTELRLSQLALWILEAEHHGYLYGLAIPGCEIPPSHGSAHRDQCLLSLAVFAV